MSRQISYPVTDECVAVWSRSKERASRNRFKARSLPRAETELEKGVSVLDVARSVFAEDDRNFEKVSRPTGFVSSHKNILSPSFDRTGGCRLCQKQVINKYL